MVGSATGPPQPGLPVADCGCNQAPSLFNELCGSAGSLFAVQDCLGGSYSSGSRRTRRGNYQGRVAVASASAPYVSHRQPTEHLTQPGFSGLAPLDLAPKWEGSTLTGVSDEREKQTATSCALQDCEISLRCPEMCLRRVFFLPGHASLRSRAKRNNAMAFSSGLECIMAQRRGHTYYCLASYAPWAGKLD